MCRSLSTRSRDITPFKRYRTQSEVDTAIARFIRLESAAEERRDRKPFESAEYWREHDIAINWQQRASELMP